MPNYMILQVVFGIQPANAFPADEASPATTQAKQKLIGVQR